MIQAETLHNLAQVSFPAELTSMYQFMTIPISITKKNIPGGIGLIWAIAPHMGYIHTFQSLVSILAILVANE